MGDLFLEAGKADAIPVKLNVALASGATEDEPPKITECTVLPELAEIWGRNPFVPSWAPYWRLGREFGRLFSVSKCFGEKT